MTTDLNDEMVAVSYGITPYLRESRSEPRSTISDPFYDSELFQQFLSSFKKKASSANVSINSTARAIGWFKGEDEPSAAIDAEGRRSDIELVARTICDEFQQQAVRVIYQPGHGQHSMYLFELTDVPSDSVLLELQKIGVSGARITNGRLEIADVVPLPHRILASLESAYGRATILPCEVVVITRL